MEWELSKENVQPLIKGRKVGVLNETLKAKEEGPTRANIFENQRRKMIEAIDSYEGDDPIHPWLQCIRWVEDAYPAGGDQSELLPILEACTRTFQNDEHYKSDLRYLRVWVQYASCCKEPRDIFPFLEVHSIGQDHALFYEAYATSMEICNNYSKANEIYELGIRRGAEPTSRLENMYQSFLKRMLRHNEKKLQEDQEDPYEQEKLRKFGESRITHVGIPTRNPTSFQEQQRRRVQPPQTQRPGIAVYVDCEFQPGAHPSTAQPMTAHTQAAPAWKHLGTQAEIRKENNQIPAKWTETKVPRMGKVPKHVEAHPAINVYVDEECELAQARMNAKNNGAVPASLRLRLDGGPDHCRDQEALKMNPLLHFKEGHKPSLKSLMGRKPADNTDIHDDDASTVTFSTASHLIGCDIYKSREGGYESSFEEARLERWKLSQLQLQWKPSFSPRNSAEKARMIEKSLSMFQSESVRRNSQEVSPLTKLTERESLVSDCPVSRSSIHDRGTENSTQRVLHGNSYMSTSEISFANSLPLQPNKPILSRESSLSSFDDPPGFACTMPVSQNSGALLSVVSNGEETVAIKRYAEELITLGADPKARSVDAVGHQGLLDQTINTKECLQDILSMFNRPLSCEKPRSKAKTNNPARPSAISAEGFQVFVDEELDAHPLRNSRAQKKETFEIFRDEENVPSNTGKAGIQVFVDEDLNVRPPRISRSPKKGSFEDDESVSRNPGKSAPGKGGFEVFVDEDVDVQPKKNRTKTFEIYNDEEVVSSRQLVGRPTPAPPKGTFEVFVDEDVEAASRVSSGNGMKKKEDNVPSAARKSAKGAASGLGKGAFQVYADEDLHVQLRETRIATAQGKKAFAVFEDDTLPPQRPVDRKIPKSRPMGKPKDSGLSIFVDEDLSSQPLRKPPSSSGIRR